MEEIQRGTNEVAKDLLLADAIEQAILAERKSIKRGKVIVLLSILCIALAVALIAVI